MMTAAAPQRTSSRQLPPLTVDVHYGRFLTLDPEMVGFRARIKRDMPHFNFESMMTSGDKWILTVRNAGGVTGMAVFSGTREAPMMDFYYATEPASSGVLMGAISQWRKR